MNRITKLFIFVVFQILLISIVNAKDYYEILGVDRSASKREIRKAYKNLSRLDFNLVLSQPFII